MRILMRKKKSCCKLLDSRADSQTAPAQLCDGNSCWTDCLAYQTPISDSRCSLHRGWRLLSTAGPLLVLGAPSAAAVHTLQASGPIPAAAAMQLKRLEWQQWQKRSSKLPALPSQATRHRQQPTLCCSASYGQTWPPRWARQSDIYIAYMQVFLSCVLLSHFYCCQAAACQHCLTMQPGLLAVQEAAAALYRGQQRVLGRRPDLAAFQER